jgi:hypothetical protein
MTQVRVRLAFGPRRLEYDGSQAFFERVVEPLLGRLAPGGARPPGGGAAAAPEPAPPGEAVAPAAPVAAPEPQGYRPPSYEFGQFVQKLGPEAAEPDRQIVAFVFFLWNYAKKDVIREDEVDGCFRALGLKPPPDAAAQYDGLAQRLRFLQPGPRPGTWSLTTKGANYVKTRLLGAL